MKKTLLHPVFIIAVVTAALNQIIEHHGVYIPVVHSYLDDLLCFPIVLTTGLVSYRTVYPWYRLGPWHIWPLFLFITIYFEVYLPKISMLYTADPADVLFYLAGIFIFQKTINAPNRELTSLETKNPLP